MTRIVKYKTKLTDDGKAALEKEIAVNCPNLDRKLNEPDKVVKLARDYLRLHEQTEEYLYMACVNTKLILTSVLEVSHGSVSSSIASTREIMQKALLANAVSIFLMHNHPSGDPKPSREDIDFTKKLVEAGRIVGIDVLDHLIIGRPEYASLKGRGNI